MSDILFAAGSLDAFIDEVTRDDRPAHIVAVGTKPDLIKQAPIVKELQRRGEKVFLLHTGQHYDENLSGGIEKEFGLKVDINLQAREGSLTTKVGQMIDKWGSVLEAVVQGVRSQESGVRIIPYVHGDTTTAFGVTTASFMWGVPVVHVEAGIRTEMIALANSQQPIANSPFETWLKTSSDRTHYTKGSHEPFPEQWNTRCTEAGTGLFMAPVEEAAENLKQEGFPESRIFTVGNSVADAMDFVDEIESDVFERYPTLADGFIRVCIHRRENTESRERFEALFEMIEKLMANSQKPIALPPLLWILLPGTKQAIERFGLGERLEALQKNPRMVISDVWPKYSDVVAAMKRCKLCATDSGSMQEEMNLMQIPCATLRFGSDRPETLFARSNVLCPPTDPDTMVGIIQGALAHPELFKFPPLYGEKVSEKIVDHVLAFLEKGGEMMRLRPA